MDPANPGDVPANSLFFDAASSGILSQKNASNLSNQIAQATSNDLMIKVMQNLSGVTIPAGKPISKAADGSILASDSDGSTASQTYCGITLDSINNGSTGRVLLVGPNVPNVITGLNYTPGQDIFLSESGGYTNNAGSFTGNNDSIIKVGIADCAAGNASSTATDLIMFPDVLVKP
jgi:hypothetical protein